MHAGIFNSFLSLSPVLSFTCLPLTSPNHPPLGTTLHNQDCIHQASYTNIKPCTFPSFSCRVKYTHARFHFSLSLAPFLLLAAFHLATPSVFIRYSLVTRLSVASNTPSYVSITYPTPPLLPPSISLSICLSVSLSVCLCIHPSHFPSSLSFWLIHLRLSSSNISFSLLPSYIFAFLDFFPSRYLFFFLLHLFTR